ncbi:ATP-dependent DNA helicase [Desulfonema limicola]|uniref:DNA helicase RecQ n=1 Tax=Desulfonema limicola TaxID=45656 RepID=A0A975GIT2_9BACT|nr:DNA helicase RecQ [Desulfonema limicola]QTA82258.1 ATP-dependent DNA helicase [Desulfonema limicola]
MNYNNFHVREPLGTVMSPKEILRNYFGYDNFRKHQKDIIHKIISGRDAFVLMPTGSGKSLCYQIPAMIRPGVGIVISPLIALMQDQTDALKQMGIRAEFLNSSLAYEQAKAVEQRVLSGQTDLLYVAPERLVTSSFQYLLSQTRVSLFAIDEAHCISQWGHDFRPEYLQISFFLQNYPGVPRIALTATADNVTRREILAKLNLVHAPRFISSFDRPNICYRVEPRQNAIKQLSDFIKTEHRGNSGIVYCLSRNQTEQTAQQLSRQGFTAIPYHAGLDSKIRMNHQRRFLREDGIIIVATIAFGMGIDKPDVRFVAHAGMPHSMEAYYQETGRAGRDGLPSDAWMLYSLADVITLRRILEKSEGSEQFKRIRQKKAEAMLGYCETTRCRRQVLLGYFDEKLEKPCGNCDVCRGKIETWDGTIAAQKALSCVYRTGQRFGAEHLSNVLLGISNEKISYFKHDRVSTFGIGTELSKKEWKSVFRQLAAAGLLCVDVESKGGFYLSPASKAVLRGEQEVRFRKDPVPAKDTARLRKFRSAGTEEYEFNDPASLELWKNLKALRLKIARERDLPPFAIFHDRTLRELVIHLPSSFSEMEMIFGIGKKKLEQFGNQFLEQLELHIQKYGKPDRTSSHSLQNKDTIEEESNSSSIYSSTVLETLEYIQKGFCPQDIAEKRGLKTSTIYNHLADIIDAGRLSVDEVVSLDKSEIKSIEDALRGLPEDQKNVLKPVFEKFEGRYDYGILRCVRSGLWADKIK